MSKPDSPSTILSRAADLIRDTAAGASPGAWSTEDLAPHGHPGVWWIECRHADAEGTTYSTVAEAASINSAADARWVALMSPVVAPWLESILRRAAGRVKLAKSWDEVADTGERRLAEHVIAMLGKEDGDAD